MGYGVTAEVIGGVFAAGYAVLALLWLRQRRGHGGSKES
jgi:hypothetical protein